MDKGCKKTDKTYINILMKKEKVAKKVAEGK
jgi:hypothetical protein